MTKDLTWEEVIVDLKAVDVPNLEKWLARGDGVAVYADTRFPPGAEGSRRWVSYGSPAAQLELPEPPIKFPDLGDYATEFLRLVGTHRRS